MAGHGHEPAAHGHTGDIGEDYNIGTIVTVAVVGCLLMVLTIVWLKAMYARAERWEWERKVVNEGFAELEKQREAQTIKLNSWEWSDPARNRVTVPLAQIQSAVLLQLQQEQAAQTRPGTAAVVPPEPADTADVDTIAKAGAGHAASDTQTEPPAGAH